MQDNHLKIKDAINNLIEQSLQPNGRSLYYIIQDNSISLGDESGLYTTIWESTLNNKSDDEYEQDSILCNKIPNIDIATLCDMHPLKADGLHIIYTNEPGDTITINISDHSIYLITFASGQY